METRTAVIELTDQGYINVRIKPKVIVTSIDAEESVEAICLLAGDRKRLVLIEATSKSLLEKDACEVFLGPKVGQKTLAAAIFVKSKPAQIVSSLIVKKLQREGSELPVAVFSQKDRAFTWLAEQRDRYHLDGHHSMIAGLDEELPSRSLFMTL